MSGSTTTYNWDFENRMTSVVLPGSGGTVSFKYDPFGRRIEKVSSTATIIYAYDGDNVVEQLNANGTATARYTQGLGIDEPLEVYEGNASYYYHADGLGSIVALTKSNGSAVNTYFGYNTFGGMPAPTETVANPFRFTARDYDSETGLYYYRARYYDSLFGRFLSEDPDDFASGPNFFVYVGNEPTLFVDPSGLRGRRPKQNGSRTPSDSVYVICCKKGTFGICPGPSGPGPNDWTGDCEREHEKQHVIDFKNGTVSSLTNCKDPKNEGRPVQVDQKNKDLAECSANKREFRCLKSADQQLQSIKDRKAHILQQIEKYCDSCGGQ